MTKSPVDMEQHQCVVCGVLFDTGAILLHRFLKPVLEQHTVTGLGVCPEHQKMKDDGYIALIEVGADLKTRTGNLTHIRASVWPNIFNTPVPEHGIAYVPQEVTALLQRLADEAE